MMTMTEAATERVADFLIPSIDVEPYAIRRRFLPMETLLNMKAIGRVAVVIPPYMFGGVQYKEVQTRWVA